MQPVKLYRKRYVPNEIILLKDDELLLQKDDILVTRWHTLKPRRDIASGISAYFLNHGFKVSKVFDCEGGFVHWYCDIIDTEYNSAENSYIFNDLLLDVVIKKNNSLQVLDVAEAAEAFRDGIITKEQLIDALTKLDKLLNYIYSGEFKRLQTVVEAYEGK